MLRAFRSLITIVNVWPSGASMTTTKSCPAGSKGMASWIACGAACSKGQIRQRASEGLEGAQAVGRRWGRERPEQADECRNRCFL